MKKLTLLLAATCMLTPIASSAQNEPKATIEVMHHWVSQGEVQALNVIRNNFEDKGYVWKDAAVGGMSGGNVQQALRARLTAGDPPAVMQFLGYEGVQWGQEGLLHRLDEVANQGNWRDVLPEQILPFITVDGHFIAAPINMHRLNWVWANKRVFDAHNIAVPKSWPELIEAGKKLQKQGVIPIAMGDEPWQIAIIFDALMADLGGAEFYQKAAIDLDPQALGSEQMVQVFDMLRQVRFLVDDHFVGRDWAVATELVINGQAGMQFMGDWAKGEFLVKGLQEGEDFYCFATPGATPIYQWLIDNLGMFEIDNDAIRQGQDAFAQTVMDAQVQADFNKIKGAIPTRTDIAMVDFDQCAQISYRDREQAIKAGGMLGAQSHGFAAQPEFAAVFSDVAAEFFVSNMASEDAVKMLLSGIDNAR